MKVYSTYCSSSKVNTKQPVAAKELYKSQRIDYIFQLAKKNDHQLFILSGKYGLLESQRKIPYYDHLLTPKEVTSHSDIVAKQLLENGITEILFYARDKNLDKNIQTYIDCISLAAKKVNISLQVKLYQTT